MAQNPVDEQADAILLTRRPAGAARSRTRVIFPYIIPAAFDQPRPRACLAVEDALNGDRVILLAPQRDGSIEEPGEDGPPRDRHGRPDHADAEVARRPGADPDPGSRQGPPALSEPDRAPSFEPVSRNVDEAGEPHHGLESEALVRSVKEGLEDGRQPGQGHLLRGHGDRRESRSPGPAGGSGGQQPRPARRTKPSSCWRRHRRFQRLRKVGRPADPARSSS